MTSERWDSNSILLKPGPLDDDEWEIMRKHPVYAYEMLYPIEYLRRPLTSPIAIMRNGTARATPEGWKGKLSPGGTAVRRR